VRKRVGDPSQSLKQNKTKTGRGSMMCDEKLLLYWWRLLVSHMPGGSSVLAYAFHDLRASPTV